MSRYVLLKYWVHIHLMKITPVRVVQPYQRARSAIKEYAVISSKTVAKVTSKISKRCSTWGGAIITPPKDNYWQGRIQGESKTRTTIEVGHNAFCGLGLDTKSQIGHKSQTKITCNMNNLPGNRTAGRDISQYSCYLKTTATFKTEYLLVIHQNTWGVTGIKLSTNSFAWAIRAQWSTMVIRWSSQSEIIEQRYITRHSWTFAWDPKAQPYQVD